MQEDYVKIGLRRLQLAEHYNGERLEKEARTFEKEKMVSPYSLTLFEETNGAYVHK